MGELLTTMDVAVGMLKAHEGYRRVPYRDTVGKLTVGYGRNLDAQGLSPAESVFLLEQDIQRAMKALINYHWYLQLDAVRQAVLVDMAVNIGVEGLLKFTAMVACLERKDFCGASHQIITSRAAAQNPVRYKDLARLMDTHGIGD